MELYFLDEEYALEVEKDFLYLLSPAGVGANALLVSEELEKFLEEDFSGEFFTASSVITDAIEGKRQIWLMFEEGEYTAFFTTEVLAYPKATVLFVSFAYGKPGKAAMLKAHHYVEQYAKMRECKYLQSDGRTGWTRLVKRNWKKFTKGLYEVS